MSKRLRVLVIDDSSYNRETISRILGSHEDIEVIGRAADGEQGLKMAAAERPDLITLDVEMPRMDGFTFLRLLMARIPTPVIMVSSHSRKHEVFQALELGALDFVAKPSRYFSYEDPALRDEILTKALAVRALQVVPLTQRAREKSKVEPVLPENKVTAQPSTPVERVVCIGASTGGPPALQSVFRTLQAGTPTAFLVAQHMPEKFTRAFAERLDRLSALQIREAHHGMQVKPDTILIAPGGFHMEVVAPGETPVVHLTLASKEDRYAPSIDRLFASAAELFGASVLAVVLTGMGSDGSLGVKRVYSQLGMTIAESRETSIVFGMPKEAIETGCIRDILPLSAIIERIQSFCAGR